MKRGGGGTQGKDRTPSSVDMDFSRQVTLGCLYCKHVFGFAGLHIKGLLRSVHEIQGGC